MKIIQRGLFRFWGRDNKSLEPKRKLQRINNFFFKTAHPSSIFPEHRAIILNAYLVIEPERTNRIGSVIGILGNDSIMRHRLLGLKLLGDERVGCLEGIGNLHRLFGSPLRKRETKTQRKEVSEDSYWFCFTISLPNRASSASCCLPS